MFQPQEWHVPDGGFSFSLDPGVKEITEAETKALPTLYIYIYTHTHIYVTYISYIYIYIYT